MTDLTNLREGDRIVLSSGSAWTFPMERPWLRDETRAGLRVVRFVRTDGDRIIHLDDDGKEDAAEARNLAWASPLPDIGDEGSITLVGACLDARESPVLLHIRSHGTDGHVAMAIDTTAQTGLPQFGATSELLAVAFADHDPAGNDLVVAMGHEISFEDGLAIHRFAHAETIGRHISATKAHALMTQPRLRRSRRLRIATPSEIVRRRELAWASTFPDQALVLVRKRRGMVMPTMTFLAMSGRTLVESDDPESDFGGSCDRGLWMLRNVKWWNSETHEGEKDGGLTADWCPATHNDAAAFGLTPEEIGRMIPRVDGDETDSMGDVDIFDHHAAIASRSDEDETAHDDHETVS